MSGLAKIFLTEQEQKKYKSPTQPQWNISYNYIRFDLIIMLLY